MTNNDMVRIVNYYLRDPSAKPVMEDESLDSYDRGDIEIFLSKVWMYARRGIKDGAFDK
jgi:hypothetical protein